MGIPVPGDGTLGKGYGVVVMTNGDNGLPLL
jgi:hypothetical protein